MHESEKWKWSHSVLSDPQRPHGLQPTRLLRPWDFPGRSTGVGCHCLLSVLFLSWLWAKSSSGCSLYARLLAKILKYAAYAIDHCSWVQRFVIQTQSSTPSKCLLLLTCLGTLVWWLRLGQERGMIGYYRWNYDSECLGFEPLELQTVFFMKKHPALGPRCQRVTPNLEGPLCPPPHGTQHHSGTWRHWKFWETAFLAHSWPSVSKWTSSAEAVINFSSSCLPAMMVDKLEQTRNNTVNAPRAGQRCLYNSATVPSHTVGAQYIVIEWMQWWKLKDGFLYMEKALVWGLSEIMRIIWWGMGGTAPV